MCYIDMCYEDMQTFTLSSFPFLNQPIKKATKLIQFVAQK